jgi:hypothetical protein
MQWINPSWPGEVFQWVMVDYAMSAAQMKMVNELANYMPLDLAVEIVAGPSAKVVKGT